ncbi:MAG: hypothetical protein AB7W37_17865, partial [Syntrophobacteraceae bacterium]
MEVLPSRSGGGGDCWILRARTLPCVSMALTPASNVIPSKAGIHGLCGFLAPGFRRGGDKPAKQ